MRGNGRQGGRKLIGQLNKAMDRTGDSVLHRVRPQSGERINMHNRQPPKGPRGGMQNRQFNNGVPNGPKGPGINRNQPMMNNQFSQQQQMQLFSLLSQMISSPMPGMPGMPAPVINPNFRGNQGNQGSGKSLFERIGGRQQNGNFHGKHHDGNKPQDGSDDVAMEGTETSKPELGPDTICKYNLKCTKADCIFAHQSPAAPPGTNIDVSDTCAYGVACQNKKCTARHPSPAQKKAHQAEQDCKFFPNCTNPHCPFRHPDMPLCRNGADCKTEGCKFTHLQAKCKFTPCLNTSCPYKHEEGQQKPKLGYSDMVWTPETAAKKNNHVSERKFVDEGVEEELVVPDQEDTDVAT
jgi:nuclear polyadenylated RNA-binding protein NAB2